jgi:predicted P-loop ATPase
VIDFASLAARLLQQSRSLLPAWFPAGKMNGHEFEVGDLAGSEGKSLKINVNTGAWSDFSSGDAGGDLISLYAAMHGLKQSEAVKALEGDGTIATRVPPAPAAKPERGEWTPILPPADAPKPTDEFYRKEQGEWVKLLVRLRWSYTDATGALIGYVCRFEWYDADELKKDVIPQVYCQHADGRKQWRWRAFADPRPLYNLKELADRPDAPVMIVEGEKKVEALRKLAPQYVGIAWPGGAKAWRKADWRPIKGRKVLCWPDADQKTVKTEREAQRYGVAIGEMIPRDMQPGILAMWEIGHHVIGYCPEVKIILPTGKPDGWDAADAVAEGMDWQAFKAWAIPLVQQLEEGATDGRRKTAARDTGVSTQGSSAEADHGGRGQGSGTRDRDGRADVDTSQAGDRAAGHTDLARRDDASEADRGADRAQPSDRGTEVGPRRDAGGTATLRDDEPRSSGRDHEAGTLSRTVQAERGSGDGARSTELRTDADPAQPAKQAGARTAPAEAQGQVGRWLSWGLDRNGNGLPYTNLNNAVRVLEADPSIRGVCWFDEFLQRILTGDPVREWSDADDINLTLYMQREVGLTKMALEVVRNAVVVAARQDTRNCVRDWMNSLAHDGTPRIDHFFIDVFGAKDDEYVRAAGRNFWISIAARVFDPGCKVDNMIILEGAQGLGKSMALQIIGGDWYAAQHESATNAKAFAEILQGKLIIEIEEMDAFNRAEVNTIKKIVSAPADRYRAAYGRHAADHKRQCVMIGTTNKDDWNRDETGARRSWPIKCDGLVRIDVLRENRAQLFAEAVAAYKAGSRWWEMPDAQTRQEQRARYDADPWLGAISGWVATLSETNTNEILIGCLHYSIRDITRTEQMRVAACLRILGWTNSGNKRRNGEQVRVWIPPSALGLDAAGSSGQVATKKDHPFQ